MCAGTRRDQGFRTSVSCEDLMCVIGTALVFSGKVVCILKSCPPLLHLRTLLQFVMSDRGFSL